MCRQLCEEDVARGCLVHMAGRVDLIGCAQRHNDNTTHAVLYFSSRDHSAEASAFCEICPPTVLEFLQHVRVHSTKLGPSKHEVDNSHPRFAPYLESPSRLCPTTTGTTQIPRALMLTKGGCRTPSQTARAETLHYLLKLCPRHPPCRSQQIIEPGRKHAPCRSLQREQLALPTPFKCSK